MLDLRRYILTAISHLSITNTRGIQSQTGRASESSACDHIKPILIKTSYSSSQEILSYFKDVVAKHDLLQFAKLNHRVLGAWWNDEVGKWNIKVQPGDNAEDAFFDTGDVLVNATGVLK
jgi:cation diffusion facilitator CzcD-associated flavoprotein CzcO